MRKTKTMNKGEQSPLRRACLAGLIGTVVALALLFVSALLMERLLLPQGSASACGRAVLFLSALCAACLACGKGSGEKAVRAGISAAVLFIFVLFAAVLTESSSVVNMSLLWNLLCIICGAAAGLLLTTRRRKRRRRRV